jgi:hypothetical protein
MVARDITVGYDVESWRKATRKIGACFEKVSQCNTVWSHGKKEIKVVQWG